MHRITECSCVVLHDQLEKFLLGSKMTMNQRVIHLRKRRYIANRNGIRASPAKEIIGG